jgi:hypothetical protein
MNEVDDDVTEITCGLCVQNQIFFPQLKDTKKSRELGMNEFFLIVSNYGYIWKGISKREFNILKDWNGIILAQKVRKGQRLFFQVGNTEHKKWISYIKTAIPYAKNDYLFDIGDLSKDLNYGSRIQEAWVE